jgi:hypothetical protein
MHRSFERGGSMTKGKTAFVVVFLLATLAGIPGQRMSSAQGQPSDKDVRKQAGFDPTKFPGDDLTPLLKGKTFTDGKHDLKTFADGTKLTIETKKNKITKAFLTGPDGSESDATIHSPAGTPTARSFTVGVTVHTPGRERCYICTIGRDKGGPQSSGATTRARQRLITCFKAPCDIFFPEPDPPTIDPLKKAPEPGKAPPKEGVQPTPRH